MPRSTDRVSASPGGELRYRHNASLVAAVFAAAFACSTTTKQAGGLMLILDTDLMTPSDFNVLRLEISQESAPGGAWNTLHKRDYLIPDEATFPTTFAMAAGSGTDQEVLIRVTAVNISGQPVVLREAQVQVPTNRFAELRLVLARACVGLLTCPSGESCQPDAGMCGSSVIDAASLPEFRPSDVDAGRFVPGDGAPGSSASGSSSGSGGGPGFNMSSDASVGHGGSSSGAMGMVADGAVSGGGGDGNAPINACAGSADCATSQICCSTASGNQCEAACASGSQVCATTAECPSGQSCSGSHLCGVAGDAATGMDCPSYCSLIQSVCTGQFQQYASNAECLRACQYFPTTNADIGNTLVCRIQHANNVVKLSAPNPHCWHAGPYGWGVCGNQCDNFCALATNYCVPSGGFVPQSGAPPYASLNDCMTACASFAEVGGSGSAIVVSDGGLSSASYNAMGPTSGNTLDCREYHLGAALQSTALQQIHCFHVAATSATCQ